MIIHKDDPALCMEDAHSQLVAHYAAEHGGCYPQTVAAIGKALALDGGKINFYEIHALVGGMPVLEDGVDDDDDSYPPEYDSQDPPECDYSCPPWVRKKFPHLDKILGDL